MSYINKYLRNFKPYAVASHKIWQVPENEKKTILKLDWNEATIQPSPIVQERLLNLMNTDFLNLYPSTTNTELIYLLSEYTKLPKKNIQYFASSDSLHEYIAKMFISVGDPVLILWPSYDNFRLTAQVAGAHVMFFELDDDFSLNKQLFEDKIGQKEPSLVYICNPNNPTGLELSNEYIEFLVKKFPNTMFLLDEAYSEFGNVTCKDMVLKYDNILISRTLSKAFALANIRVGYLLASSENISFISSIRNPKNITTVSQEAAIGALSDINYMNKYVMEVKGTRDHFIKIINSKCKRFFKAYPSQGNFVLIRCCDSLIKKEIIAYLERRNIFIRNISQSKNVEECVRVSIGLKEQMDIVLNYFIEFSNVK